MPPFVLVHGAFHGAWCWVKLIPALAARGARAVALDLPAQGDDETPAADVTLEANVERIAKAVAAQAEPVVLVAHSVGGVSVTALAERAPWQIATMVYLTAFAPRDGEAVNDLGRLPQARKDERSEYVFSADRVLMSPRPESIRERYYNDCADGDVAFAMPRLRPLPRSVLRTSVQLTAERYGSVLRVYIVCGDDRTISPALQRTMAERSGTPIAATLPTGHSPFFSAPDRLADALVRIAAQPPKR